MDLSSKPLSNIFNFATDQARSIVYLHYIDLVVCLTIGLLVAGLLVYVIVKYRHREGDAEPEQTPGNMKLEITWTVIPALILAGLGIGTALVMHEVNPPVRKRQPDVVVTAHQWWWEYHYPKTGVITANELYMPEGVDYLFEIKSADVVHSFWVPEFGEKMDAIPGHPNYIFFKPFKKGVFTGACSEYCGANHSLMRIIVRVVSKQDFERWTRDQLRTPEKVSSPEARRGESLFHSRTCIECHRISGTAATATIGPDLTHVSQRTTLGAGLIANNRENMSNWIVDAQKYKPGCYMPMTRLTRAQADDISIYLESIK